MHLRYLINYVSSPEVLSQETVYKGKVFDIRVDEIRDGEIQYKRDIIVHGGSCVILPVFADGTLALVRQYRHAARKYLLEIPAGTLEPGEDPLEGARRELEEEIGVTAETITPLAAFYVSPGFLTEKMHVFLATGLTDVGQKLEPDEILTIERHLLTDLMQMIADGSIEDAKTIIAILRYREQQQS